MKSKIYLILSLLLLVTINSCAQQSDTNEEKSKLTNSKQQSNQSNESVGKGYAGKQQNEAKIPAQELILNEEQLKIYYQSYQDPNVKYLRKVFDAFLSSGKLNDDEHHALEAVGSEYLKSKFIVFSRDYSPETNPMGGMTIDIMFQDKPDKVFRAWIYGVPKFRALRILSVVDYYSEKDIQNLQSRYKKFLEDKKHAL